MSYYSVRAPKLSKYVHTYSMNVILCSLLELLCIFLLGFFQSTYLCMDQRFEHFFVLYVRVIHSTACPKEIGFLEENLLSLWLEEGTGFKYIYEYLS